MRLNRKFIIILFIILGVFLFLFLNLGNKNNYLDVKFTDESKNIEKNDNIEKQINYNKEINDEKEEYSNEDVVGILKFENINKKISVVQTSDNDFYLNHDLNKNPSDKGSVFLDYRVNIDSSKKLLIYGHSSENIYTDFNFLQNYYDRDYYDNHKYLEIITSTMKKKYEIFSIYTEVDDFSYMQTDFKSELEYVSHINELKNNSIYQTEVELSHDDEILIIQTCSMDKNYDKYRDKYLIIISRRV